MRSAGTGITPIVLSFVELLLESTKSYQTG